MIKVNQARRDAWDLVIAVMDAEFQRVDEEFKDYSEIDRKKIKRACQEVITVANKKKAQNAD